MEHVLPNYMYFGAGHEEPLWARNKRKTFLVIERPRISWQKGRVMKVGHEMFQNDFPVFNSYYFCIPSYLSTTPSSYESRKRDCPSNLIGFITPILSHNKSSFPHERTFLCYTLSAKLGCNSDRIIILNPS